MTRITRRLTDQFVTFHGYDDRTYKAFVSRVHRGTAVLHYGVSVSGQRREVVAYISDPSRIDEEPRAAQRDDKVTR